MEPIGSYFSADSEKSNDRCHLCPRAQGNEVSNREEGKATGRADEYGTALRARRRTVLKTGKCQVNRYEDKLHKRDELAGGRRSHTPAMAIKETSK